MTWFPLALILVPAVFSPTPQEESALESAAPEGYLAPDAVLDAVRALARPGQVEVRALARTPEGRDLLVAEFGVRQAPGRPAILIVADPSGDRPVASQVALALCRTLASGGSPLLERASVHVVPVADPDAAAHVFRGQGAWSGEAVDEDRDGLQDEDPAEDLDGDGRVLWMRIPDAAGEWRADAEDPRLLVPARREDGEAGEYRLEREGADQDGDRRRNEDGPGGVCLASNWPHGWIAHAPQSGPWPLSREENRALAEYVLRNRHFLLALFLGDSENLAEVPDAVEQSDGAARGPLAADRDLLKVLAGRFMDGLAAPPHGEAAGPGHPAGWASHQAGLLVLESSLWAPPAVAGGDAGEAGVGAGKAHESEEVRLARRELAWNDAKLGGAGFVPWRPFRHPELGQVEIGGWLPLVRENPPAEHIPDLARHCSAFLDSLATDLPRLEWRRVEVRSLGAGVFEARAALVDPALLPTAAAVGVEVRRAMPVRVDLELPAGGQILAGRATRTLSRLEGLGGQQEYEWLYRIPEGGGRARIRAGSPTSGEAVVELRAEDE